MPGRYKALREFVDQCRSEAIDEVVCLVDEKEIEKKSPEYAAALKAGQFPLAMTQIPVLDYGVPDDVNEFVTSAQEVVEKLRRGRNLVIHCAAGVGRTGMFAILVLHEAGESIAAARAAVQRAGSKPENEEQNAFLENIAARTGTHKSSIPT